MLEFSSIKNELFTFFHIFYESKIMIKPLRYFYLIMLAAVSLVLSGCIGSGVVNLQSKSDTSKPAVFYTPVDNAAYINQVNGKHVLTYGAIAAADVKTVYVSPGPVEIVVRALWNSTIYFTDSRVDAKSGHVYRVIFDKSSRSFQIEDLGPDATPSNMKK